ncbi:MAG: hypothetical protein BGO98_34285 [Myxococcales bacterium 68-20]|nr:MAG: hypothetical protein BGO98_34285 [Myxococcales bacterium 68-20]
MTRSNTAARVPGAGAGAAWTRAARGAAKKALDPVLRELGFSGSFPSYRRADDGQVNVVHVDVRLRTGLTLDIFSLPPGSKLGTWRSEKATKTVSRIPSTVGITELPRKLDAACRRLRREATAFWKECQGLWTSDARSTRQNDERERIATVRALLDGDARALAAAVSRLGPSAFANAVATARFNRSDKAVQRNIWKCGAVLIRQAPPSYEIAASLVVSAIEQLHTGVDAKSRARAREVLAWARPHMHQMKHLAGQVSLVARSCAYDGDCALAVSLFEFVVECADGRSVELGAPDMACALYSALAANNPAPPAGDVQRRLLSLATSAYPRDRFVRFNAACLFEELGDEEVSVGHLLAALKLGVAPKAVSAQAGLRRTRSDPRVARVLRGGRATKTASAAAGLLPP